MSLVGSNLADQIRTYISQLDRNIYDITNDYQPLLECEVILIDNHRDHYQIEIHDHGVVELLHCEYHDDELVEIGFCEITNFSDFLKVFAPVS